jgi:hypothetical protein
MYHIIITGIAATILCLINYLFYRTGFISQQDNGFKFECLKYLVDS